MSGLFLKMKTDKRILVVVLISVFLVGWLSFTYYIYTNQILVIPIQGEIESSSDAYYSLRLGMYDSNVKAVILYLNTPGGGAYASMEIADYVGQLKKIKPVIAVMEDICASGGYYIASFATYIFAHSYTLTGSIGVISVWTDMSEYYRQQGINITVWATGTEKDLGADWRGPTHQEYNEINATVYSIFQTLLDNIQRNRSLSKDSIDIVKTGATFSGSDAVKLGLVDKIGDLFDAIEEARTGMLKFIIVFPDMAERQKFLSALL